MKLPPSSFLFSAFVLLSATVSCMAGNPGASCRALLQRINDRRRANGMKDVINPDVFLTVIGGDNPGCTRTLQLVLDYSADKSTAENFCEGESVCTVTREKIKQVISHALVGNYKEVTKNIMYNFQDNNNLFPLYLKNYFAVTAHDGHRVTVHMHKLRQADLNPNAQFQSFLLQTGEPGELEDVVPVVTKIDPSFLNALQGTDLEEHVRSRHLDLMLTTLMPPMPADSAVLVSDFQSFSTATGQPAFSETNRKVLFMNVITAFPYTFDQYDWRTVSHQLTKAKAGFSAVPREKVIETGYWKSFAADPKLRLLIQLLAAAETGHRLLFKIPHVPMGRLVELTQFLTDVTDHHPQNVLRALQAFLPRLIQRKANLDDPASTREFMEFLAQPGHQMVDVVNGEKEEELEVVHHQPHQHQSQITFQQLLQNSENFAKNLLYTNGNFPVTNNLISTLAKNEEKYPRDSFVRQADGVRILLHRRIILMMEAFLKEKLKHGSSKEKALYQEMTVNQFIDRLLQKRPLMFMGRGDTTLLPGYPNADRAQQAWFQVGTENEVAPLVLANYLSYDEMELSAFVNVATPTYFINNGNRGNEGKPGAPGSFQPEGIYIAAVGARFEVPGRMEYKYLDVNRSRNVNDPMYPMFQQWESLYEVSNDPTFIPGIYDHQNRVQPPNINRHGFAVRMQLTLEPIILYANQVAGEQHKKARLRLVGLGIGVWAVNQPEQGKVIVEVVKHILRSHDLPHIGKIEFPWFPNDALLAGPPLDNYSRDLIDDPYKPNTTWTRISGPFSVRQGRKIILDQNRANPADPIDAGEHLVAVYAWDSNSFPGNEYWARQLAASGDPAAACCSTIQELQNPFINTTLRAEQKLIPYGSEGPSGLQLHQAPQPHSGPSNYPQQPGPSRFSPPPAPAAPANQFAEPQYRFLGPPPSPANLSPQPAFLGPPQSPYHPAPSQQSPPSPSPNPPAFPTRAPLSFNPSRPPPPLNPSPPPSLNPTHPPPPLPAHLQNQSPQPPFMQAPQSHYQPAPQSAYRGQQQQPAYYPSPQPQFQQPPQQQQQQQYWASPQGYPQNQYQQGRW